jgi:inner membrane protease ATP23
MEAAPAAAPTRCESLRDKAMASIYVKFMRERMLALGCDTAAPNFAFVCEPCNDPGTVGRFDANRLAVVLCSDNIDKFRLSKNHVERTMLHELVHAYDHCRVELDPNNCEHIACTEVRAAHLSGDCDLKNELERRNFAFKGQGSACARRRAELSVASHPQCAAKAAETVEAVFDKCYSDTAPYARKCT